MPTIYLAHLVYCALPVLAAWCAWRAYTLATRRPRPRLVRSRGHLTPYINPE